MSINKISATDADSGAGQYTFHCLKSKLIRRRLTKIHPLEIR